MSLTQWIDAAMFGGFFLFVCTLFGRMYFDHRRRQARNRRMEQFRKWVQRPKTPEEALETHHHVFRVIENPHTDYRGPWETYDG